MSTVDRADGSFADGVSRVAYSDADVAGRAYALRLMREAGLDPLVDAAGNITAEMLREPEPPAPAPVPEMEHQSTFRAPQFGLGD